MESHIKLVKDVFIDEKNLIYTIRIDGETCAYSDAECEAKKIVDTIIQDEIKRQQAIPSIKVLREDFENGSHVVAQKLGYIYNGTLYKVCTVDFVPIPLVYRTNPPPLPPPLPPVSVIETVIEDIVLPSEPPKVDAVTIDGLEKIIRQLETNIVDA